MTGAEAALDGRANLAECPHVSFDDENSFAPKEDMTGEISSRIKLLWRASGRGRMFFIFVHKKLY
jgi:hypothetical protein